MVQFHCAVSDIKLLKKIGEGTFGNVYLSQIKSEYYAVKVMKKQKIKRLKQTSHVMTERDIALSIEHPFVVKTHATLQDTKYLYIVMEYVPGGDMFSFLKLTDVLPVFAAVFYISEVVLFLEGLHKQNIIYRDLKPENILLDLDGHIKMTDFGLSKRILDVTYTICGTPEYLAPEIILSNGYEKSVDWYMVGVVLFEMLTGNPPFMAETRSELYKKIVNEKVVCPSEIDSITADLIYRLLEKDPVRRLGSTVEHTSAIKKHAWFSHVNWNKLYTKQVKTPHRPTVRSIDDTSNFEEYSENEEYGDGGVLFTKYDDGFDGFDSAASFS